jgi:TPP-dependent pyruvate/acetoin dehydrogenase alpha subunit
MAQSTAEQAPHRGVAVDDLDLYRRMRLIRRFEDLVQSLFLKSLVHGTTHLYSGEEAGAVGVASALRDGDRVAGTYRGHGHALALGSDPQGLLDELLGRSTGTCGGRGGSMNVVDLEHGLIGCFGIIGGSISAATGAALALRGTGNVAVAFFGEGTSNHGYFHECLNFAKVLGLPAIYVCENNRYSEFTPFEEATAGDLAERPRVLGIPTETVDGMDVWAVRDAAARAVERARAGEGPQFLQTLTYRFVGHSRSDPGAYRKEGELEEWRERDPLLVARARLSEDGTADAAALDAVDAEVEERLKEVEGRAIEAPFPEASDLGTEFKG